METQWIYGFYALVGSVCLLCILAWRKKKSSLPLPSGPSGWPVVGNLFQLGKRPHESLSTLSQQYGPLMTLRLGMRTTVVVSSAAMAKEILKTHDHVFAGRIVLQAIKMLSHHKSSISFGQNGPYWRKLRRISATELMSRQKLEALQHLRRDEELLTSGIDTTGSALEWAMAEVIRNPEIMKRVQAELEEEVGLSRRVEEGDIERLPYLKAVVKEVLRLHPPAPLLLPHRADSCCDVSGFRVPKHTQVMVNVWAIGRDPAGWKDPCVFSPERFLQGDKAKVDFKGQDFDFTPFGAGRRICPVLPLVDKLLHYILASLLHSFDWALPDGMGGEELDMTDVFGVVLKKRSEMYAIPTPRLSHNLF